MVDVRFQPGAPTDSWRAVVSGQTVAVLPPATTATTAEAVWRRLAAGGIAALIEGLTGAFGTSLTAIPPFALATVEDGGVRVAVRGPIELVVESPDGIEAVSGAGVATWVERLIEGAYRVTLAVDGAVDPADTLPLLDGVVPIAGVVLVAGPIPPASPPAPAEQAGAANPDGPAAEQAGAANPDGPAAEQSDAANPDGPTAEESGPAAEELGPAAEEPGPTVDDSGPAAQEAGDPDDDGAVVAEVPGAVADPAGAAATDEVPVDADAPDPAPPASEAADTWLPAATAAPPSEDDMMFGETLARPSAPAAPASTAGAVPAVPGTLPPVPPLPPLPDLGDHDGATIAVAEMRKLRDAEREQFESTDNVPPRRPSQGRIRLSTGRVVELERPVVIGRRPKSTRASGEELPTLVAVDSPQQDISRSHVEIRAEGEHVLVTDLNTTNGTVLLRAGADPVRLHPGEPTLVVTADILDLGDGVTITFEDLP